MSQRGTKLYHDNDDIVQRVGKDGNLGQSGGAGHRHTLRDDCTECFYASGKSRRVSSTACTVLRPSFAMLYIDFLFLL
jgi:hypothetical protein